MAFEATFVAGYAVLLLGLAAGLFRLGRVSTVPWRSRALAAQRARGAAVPVDGLDDWPHSQVPRLYTVLATVAAVAAVALGVTELLRSGGWVERGVLAGVSAASVAMATGLVRSFSRR